MRTRRAGILSFVLALALLVSTIALGGVAGATGSDVERARESGESFIANATEIYPEWRGAHLAGGQAYHDLEGQVNAYMFAIKKNGQTLGRIVVGSSAYEYDVLEAGAASPPSIPNASELKTALDRDLGIQVNEKAIGKPQLVDLGYDFYLAVYEVRGQSIAFDLRARRIALTSDLKDHLLSPEQYEAQKGGVQPLGWVEWFSLPVPVRYQADPIIPPDKRNNNNCGPTSGAMVDEYYKQHRGYSNFDDWADDHNRLYETMHTNTLGVPGTKPWDLGPGFTAYAAEKGYSFGTTWYAPSYGDYNLIKAYMNAQQPIIIMFWGGAPYAQWHYCTIKGYGTYDTTKYLVINNPWGYGDIVNWDANWGWVTIHWLWPS